MNSNTTLFCGGIGAFTRHDAYGHAMPISLKGGFGIVCTDRMRLVVPDGEAQRSSVPICRGGPPK